ncbi:MAG: hypothetical protein R2713_19355 [Ilumatobacteraceae bacterium]
MCGAVGLVLKGAADVPADALAKAGALDAARRQGLRHRRRARAELQADGWTVETTKHGTTPASLTFVSRMRTCCASGSRRSDAVERTSGCS